MPEQQHPEATPGVGHHLLDVSMFWAPTGGVRRVLMAKHDRLRSLGWRHTVMAPGAQGPGLLDCGGLPLPYSGGYRLVLGRGRALRQMEFVAPDLIESADPYVLAWAALAAAERLQVPAVAFCHSDLPELAARLGRGAQRWARRYLVNLYRHFDLVMAPSRSMAQRLQAWGVPRVTLQPLGVDCSIFTPCAQDPAWRQRFCLDHGLAADTRLLIYTGRFAPEKKLQLLADAVALLGRGHALLAVGAGPAAPVGEQVLVLPPEQDGQQLARMVASCDAYVHAGDQETFGLGVLEAMACGTPVVVAGAGGLAELAQDAGLLVDRPRAGSWAEALEASLGGNNAAWRRTALARAQGQDWPRVLTQMTRRYAALLGGHSTAAAPSRERVLAPLASRLARQR
ncbi:alpha-1,6-mannosyltransferase [Pelomonas saccharophila]|uniref:Alpha-1,6-mannosyltransferase n=1 Tax=Roseateles saccharophilus TaxID=304 RepID=A0ABU1YIH3_ROSSA|nr:glycosyltransferase [Roseateles saccharophilus]MDR7268652.1 alpha-1,6-mannosyltransferase [Roseateles saccharophilus]